MSSYVDGIKLQLADLIENLGNATLVEVLGYKNGSGALMEVHDAVSGNWSKRGKGMTKERNTVMCTFATQGQGKTELCTQLAKNSDKIKPSQLSNMISIPITFGQSTIIDVTSEDRNIEKALVWRIINAFGNDEETSVSCSISLSNLLNHIRKVNCPEGCDPNSVGILLTVDEILKVKQADSEYFKRLLDLLCDRQQKDLMESCPTFLLITSLEVLPVTNELVTASHRKVTAITLPILYDLDLDAVSQQLYDHLLRVLCVGRPEMEEHKFKSFQDLHDMVRLAVSLSGSLFRTLEDAMKAIYARVVSADIHKRAQVSQHPPALLFSPTSGRNAQTVDLFNAQYTGLDLTVKEIFDVVLYQIIQSDILPEMYEQARELFLDLINYPALEVDEKLLYDLEAVKVVFVKFRSPALTTIVPRVSLPFLYFYPRWTQFWQLQGHLSNNAEAERERHTILSSQYYRLPNPVSLRFQTEVLLVSIGVALSRPFKMLSSSFEDVVPFAELLTTAAKLRLQLQAIGMTEILKDALVRPHRNESLIVSELVLKTAITIFTHPLSDGIKYHSHSGAEAVRSVVRMALDPACTAVYITQPPDLATQCVEYVSRLFSVGNRQVLCFSSMKLREKMDPVGLCKEMHKFIKEEIFSQPDISEKLHVTDYYVILYCCAPMTEEMKQQLPPGSIVVGYTCLRDLLHPFGLNSLIISAESKYQASK